jgi:transcriptional regulator with GAF, ATPase, and Fis domain
MPRAPRGDARRPEVGGLAIIGRSGVMRALLADINRVGATDATVLIVGERGTGKELVAQALQQASRRRDRPFVSVNCAALPRELLASELFGHERGAFTGALERRPGLFTLADGGTLFADEIGNLSLEGQAMLLRAIELGEVRPVGAKSTTRVEVRVVAATNKDLGRAIGAGEFLPDLHDRLSEVVLEVPPLRARDDDDIALLVEHFVGVFAERHRIRVRGVTPDAWRVLQSYGWPGNVRELINAVSRAVIFAGGGWIWPEHLRLASQDRVAGAPTDDVHRGSVGSIGQRAAAILDLARRCGSVRRGDVIARLGVSRETARKALDALVATCRLRRQGAGRGTRYVLSEGEVKLSD